MKLVLIGAGSAVFTRGLVADLILSPEMGPLELGLVDTEPEALQVAEDLCSRMIRSRDADIRVIADIDRREVLPAADVVVTTIGVGGRRSWEADVLVPREHGIFQPVGDTVMPGGISRAMRMIPALVDIARDVGSICPHAQFYNYSNPMTANCWAILEATGVPVTGLCHGTFDVQRQLASLIGAPSKQVSSLYAGINHLTFIFDLRWHGRDAWPIVRARLAEEHGQPVDTDFLDRQFPDMAAPSQSFKVSDNPFSWSLFDSYDAYPAVNDRHVTEFFPERFPKGQYFGKTLGVDVFSLEATTARGDQNFEKMRAQARGDQPLDEGVFNRTPGEHEQLVSIIKAIKEDTRRVFAVNLRNNGAVPNLPDDAVLELPAIATSGGMRPIQILNFPDPLAAILTRKLAATRVTVDAAMAGNRHLLSEALLLDGAVTDLDMAQILGEKLIETHRVHLPNFYPLEA